MTDYCASCGEALIELPGGVRLACCPEGAQYWSPHKPLQKDAACFYQFTGETLVVQTAYINPAGELVRHAPLYRYHSISGRMT